jgi:hypothetical protein
MLSIVLVLAADAKAMWRSLTTEDVAQQSDLIVIASLSNVREWTDNYVDYGEGRLAIRDVVWGDVEPGDTLTIRWHNRSSVACPRVEHRHALLTNLIWFLTLEGNGTVRADHPDRKKPVAEFARVMEVLERYPYRVKLPRGFPPGEPVVAEIVFRNATNHTLKIPAIEVRAGVIEHASGVTIQLFRRGESNFDLIDLPPEYITTRGDLPPVELEPGRTHAVSLPLSDLIGRGITGHYRFTFRIRRADEAVIHWVTLYTARQARMEAARERGEIVPYLIDVLEGDEEGDTLSALNQLRFIGRAASEAVPAIAAMYAGADGELKIHILGVLAWIDDDHERRLAFLTPLLVDPDPKIVRGALHGIRGTHFSKVRDQALIDAYYAGVLPLLDRDDDIRSAAVQSLFACKDAPVELRGKLADLVEFDHDENVRRGAQGVLNHWDGMNPCR